MTRSASHGASRTETKEYLAARFLRSGGGLGQSGEGWDEVQYYLCKFNLGADRLDHGVVDPRTRARPDAA